MVLTLGLYDTAIAALVGVDTAGVYSSIGASAIGPIAKLAVVFPLAYHYLAGMRHLYWDKRPEGLTYETQAQSSMALFGASGLIALIAMFM